MLGRQQIAGIPTAINELFKNAHDAYAQHVEVDFYRSDQMLIIRDDGYGMTKEDFESRWLTLGTESKVGKDLPDTNVPNEWAKLPRRPMMGEKGIGRLAIAAIGPQVLVMTRATRHDGLHPLVVCLIHWGLFEVPGVDLDRIEIPVQEIPDGALPDGAVLSGLKSQIRANIDALGEKVSKEDRGRLLADLDLLNFNPSRLDPMLPGPSLRGGGFGTHFYICPTNPVLADDIDAANDDTASPLQKMLLGFSNTMMPARPKPSILSEFRDHREDGTTEELIGGDSFFTPNEFASADHHIEGHFDEFGQFAGKVAVYRQEAREHSIAWPGASGKETECGPFEIKFAYLQGKWEDSRLPQEEWAPLSAKLDRIGGLYVYRDGIRILPYGNSDYDFLNIERRRTKSASDWFFSYRRIFGAVEITHDRNNNLVEKAGREGFRANRAYREFVSILENVFQRLAKDFFRETAEYGEDFNATREQLQRENELLKRREKFTRSRRKEFSDRLDNFFLQLEKGTTSAEAARIKRSVEARLASVQKIADPDRAARTLLQIEGAARNEVGLLIQANTIAKPRGFGLSKTLRTDWNAYLRNSEKLRKEIIVPLEQHLDALITSTASSKAVALDRRRRVTAALESKRSKAETGLSRLRRDVQDRLSQLGKRVEDTIQFSLTRVSSELQRTFSDLGRTDIAAIGDPDLRTLQYQWEQRIDNAIAETMEILEALRDQLQSLTSAVAQHETLDATTAAIETSAEAYKDQLETYVDLAQIGMALGIIQHEFGNTIKRIRNAIRKLKPWADGTPDLRRLHEDLQVGFEHLDAYLKLFTPLSRRLNRTKVDLSGEEIRRYVNEVFENRLQRHRIRLIAKPGFDRHKVHGYPSTFLPAFVNVIDNAIYWIASDPESERSITLDANGDGILISNGGPGIEHRAAERIFEFGETTKPGGRGIGLFLSRQSLRTENFDLTLEAIGSSVHPVFKIAPRKSQPDIEDKQ